MCAAVKAIEEGQYKKIILTRPIVESGEEIGFLPGDLNEKIAPYMKPLYQSIEHLKPHKNGNGNGSKKKKAVQQDYMEDWDKKIEISPLAYMRGLTHQNAFIIMDEAQNVTIPQMKLFLTRIGHNTKVVITGDASQSDLERRTRSGFRHAQQLLDDVEGIGFVKLTENDIVRHKLVKDIIIKYENEESYKTRTLSNMD